MRTKSKVSKEESTKCCTSSKVLCSDQTFHFLFILTKSSCKVWNTHRARQFPPPNNYVSSQDELAKRRNYTGRYIFVAKCNTHPTYVCCVTDHQKTQMLRESAELFSSLALNSCPEYLCIRIESVP